MEEEKDQLIKRVERLKKRVTSSLPQFHGSPRFTCCINLMCPLGGGSVQSSADAGAGPTAAGGEGAGGGTESSEAGAEEPGNSVI